MHVIALASGSSGNCLYIESGSEALLIDAGLAKREILGRMERAGARMDAIRGIFITHEHVDHIRGAYALARSLKVPIFGTEGTLNELVRCRAGTRNTVDLVRCREGEALETGNFTVETFPVSHDAREPCGFRVAESGVSIGCCTDTGIVTPEMEGVFSRCDALVLESNHCPEMLRTGPYPEMLKRRIRSRRGHLSNQDAAACIGRLCPDITRVMLAHLSEVNNSPEKALMATREGIGLFSGEITVAVATNPGSPAGWPNSIRL
jgi:phosphoribosyl 1,2-cyclic phosphodiesterase